MCINWVPLESSGRHAETIKGKMDEKAETVTNRVVKVGKKTYNGLIGHICITVLAQMCTISRTEQSLHNSVRVGKRHQDRESLISPTSTEVPHLFHFTMTGGCSQLS